jgi:hypothetical protein
MCVPRARRNFALTYHLENRFNKGELDIDVSVDMLKDIAGLSLGDQL